MPSRDPQELAKMLNDYADQMTKFVLLQALAFLISLSNKALLDTISKVPWFVILVPWEAVNFCEILFVYMCHLGEDELIGKPARGDPTSVWRWVIRLARFAIVLATDGIMIVGVMIIRVHAT
jgi:hypothetical protein